MAKKKVVEKEVVEPSTEFEIVDNATFESEEPTNELAVIEAVVEHRPVVTFVKVRSRDNFKDGAFTNELAACGYKTFWPREEVRLLPAQLFAKLQRRSGNRFDLIGG